MSLRRKIIEPEEEEMEANLRRLLCCRLTYGEDFSEIKPSGHIYDIKCIISAHIILMVHTPFKLAEKL